MSREVNKVLILGPPSSGKTCLLGAAHLEANLTSFQSTSYCVIARNDAMKKLLIKARNTVLTGSIGQEIDASSVPVEYAFDLRICSEPTTKSLLGYFTSNVRHVSFSFLDGPGGALLPVEDWHANEDRSEIDRFREQLIEHGRHSQGLLLCIDSENEKLAKSFFLHLPTVLSDIGPPPLHFERIAILLTKSDLRFHRERRNAQQMLNRAPALKRAAKLLTIHGLGNMLSMVDDRTAFAFGWSSAYGFIEGTANFDPEGNRLRTFDPEHRDDTIDSWQPFRVLDPFVFLATGSPGAMEVYRKTDLKALPWQSKND